MKRSEARELAFKAIYSRFFNVDLNNQEDTIETEFSKKIIDTYSYNKEEINSLISNNLKGYSLERVYKIDLAIIIVAIIELNYIKENPKEVVINEAVELAKKYSTEKSPRFINGVLADILK